MEEKMRRSDRQLIDHEVKTLLYTGEYGVLATCSAEGKPYGVPVNYVFDGDVIYFHCVKNAGKKVKNMRACEDVSFTVVGATCLLPEQFATLYESAIVLGTAREVDDQERQKALELLIDKYSAHYQEDGLIHIRGAWDRVAVYCITPTSMMGKGRKH